MHAEGAQATGSLQMALAMCQGMDPAPTEVWVIGGAELYALATPYATRAVVTELDMDAAGDAFVPRLDATWVETVRDIHISSTGIHFAFVTYLHPSNPQAGPSDLPSRLSW